MPTGLTVSRSLDQLHLGVEAGAILWSVAVDVEKYAKRGRVDVQVRHILRPVEAAQLVENLGRRHGLSLFRGFWNALISLMNKIFLLNYQKSFFQEPFLACVRCINRYRVRFVAENFVELVFLKLKDAKVKSNSVALFLHVIRDFNQPGAARNAVKIEVCWLIFT